MGGNNTTMENAALIAETLTPRFEKTTKSTPACNSLATKKPNTLPRIDILSYENTVNVIVMELEAVVVLSQSASVSEQNKVLVFNSY